MRQGLIAKVRERARMLSFNIAFAQAALITAIRFWLDPNAPFQVVGRVLHPWDYVWATVYGLGGVLTILGVVLAARPQGRDHWRAVEAGGLVLISIGVSVQAVVFASLWRTLGWSYTIATILALVVFVRAALVRVGMILRHEYVVMVTHAVDEEGESS